MESVFGQAYTFEEKETSALMLAIVKILTIMIRISAIIRIITFHVEHFAVDVLGDQTQSLCIVAFQHELVRQNADGLIVWTDVS